MISLFFAGDTLRGGVWRTADPGSIFSFIGLLKLMAACKSNHTTHSIMLESKFVTYDEVSK